MIAALVLAASFATSPAADAIGANPAGISRPDSAQALGSQLLAVVGTDGAIKPGVAIEFAPLWLVVGDELTLQEWRRSVAGRLASWTSVSIASRPLEDGGVEIAEGLKLVVVDGSDLRWDDAYAACVGRVLASEGPGWDQEWDAPQISDSAKGELRVCAEDAKRRARSSAGDGLAIAFAATHRSGEAELRRGYVWLSGSTGLGRFGEVIGSARWLHDRVEREDTLLIGMRLRARSERGAVALDASWEIPRDSPTVAFAVEARVRDDLWVGFAGGGRLGSRELFSSLNVSYSFGGKE